VQRTGHGLPAPNTFGPLCWNLFMAPGDTPHSELVAGVERGVLVTRFHYVNIVHPKKGILTGMTRDGTFLIQDGAVRGPVRNLRFTQSIPDAFSRISAIASESRLVAADYTGIMSRVPALRIDGWNFTGVTANEATV
jgi:predicted Zn-dependent protease